MALATTAAVVAIGGTVYGVANSISQNKKAKAARQEQLDGLASQQAALQGLYAEQQDPVAVFKEIFTSFPDLLQQVLPSLRQQSAESATYFTGENVKNWDTTLAKMFPEYKAQADRQLGVIKELDPANLGQEEIKAQTRMLSPLIPEGTLNPGTGAVSGALSSPVSRYRNLISGMYNDRRTQFMGANNQWLQNAENSASRQQVKSEAFLPTFLQTASQSATNLTDATMKQEQQNIAAQTAMLQATMGAMGNYDPNAGSAATAAMVSQGIKGLEGAYNLYKSGQSNTTTNPYRYNVGTTASTGASVGAAGRTSYYAGPSTSIT